MKTFKLAHASDASWQQAVDSCLQQLGKVTADYQLGFLYVTDFYAADMARIKRELMEKTGVTHWTGTIGHAVCCTGKEYYEEPAMVMMLADFPQEHFYLITSPDELSSQPKPGLQFGVMHGDPRNGQLPDLIDGLTEKLGDAYLVGGLTSSNSYYYQLADEICEGQLSGVVLSDNIPVVSGLTQGCSPIGPTHSITECEGNYAVSLDHRPALDVLKEDIGEILARDLNRIGGYIFAGFPISGSDTGDYMVRNLIGTDPDNGVLAIGEYLQTGAPIMFCRRDGKTAVDDLKRMLTHIKQRLTGEPRGGLYFSCMGRGQHMFGEVSKEMQLIQEQLGDVPLVGFYANGEIAGHHLYGYTGVLTLFL
ncbi:MAG: FIST C-terminal domain-containing protein [Gammaproteobacteria bacterium]|nr:FIST C-terminal domain-containing protein [Gammaproteobacteria bacterium]